MDNTIDIYIVSDSLGETAKQLQRLVYTSFQTTRIGI